LDSAVRTYSPFFEALVAIFLRHDLKGSPIEIGSRRKRRSGSNQTSEVEEFLAAHRTLSTPFFYMRLLNMIDVSPYYRPMIAQILHAGHGLQVSGICQSDASKV
jgi:hypothetical protein